MDEEALGRLGIEGCRADERDRHDRDARLDGGKQLEQAPWPREHAPREEQHEALALFDVIEQLAQVGEVCRGANRAAMACERGAMASSIGRRRAAVVTTGVDLHRPSRGRRDG